MCLCPPDQAGARCRRMMRSRGAVLKPRWGLWGGRGDGCGDQPSVCAGKAFWETFLRWRRSPRMPQTNVPPAMPPPPLTQRGPCHPEPGNYQPRACGPATAQPLRTHVCTNARPAACTTSHTLGQPGGARLLPHTPRAPRAAALAWGPIPFSYMLFPFQPEVGFLTWETRLYI